MFGYAHAQTVVAAAFGRPLAVRPRLARSLPFPNTRIFGHTARLEMRRGDSWTFGRWGASKALWTPFPVGATGPSADVDLRRGGQLRSR